MSDTPPPEGITIKPRLDGQEIALPGAILSRKELVHTLAVISALPALLLVGMGGYHAFSTGTWAPLLMTLLMAAATPLLFLPFFGLGWLRARGSFITVDIGPHAIRHAYMQHELSQTIPLAAIRGVSVPDAGEPRLVLDVDWSEDRIEVPPLARGKPLEWRLRSREQARWLANTVQRAATPQGTPEEIPAALGRLVGRVETAAPEG